MYTACFMCECTWRLTERARPIWMETDMENLRTVEIYRNLHVDVEHGHWCHYPMRCRFRFNGLLLCEWRQKGRAKIPRDCGVARRAECVAAIFTNAIPAVGCDLDRRPKYWPNISEMKYGNLPYVPLPDSDLPLCLWSLHNLHHGRLTPSTPTIKIAQGAWPWPRWCWLVQASPVCNAPPFCSSISMSASCLLQLQAIGNWQEWLWSSKAGRRTAVCPLHIGQ